MIKSEFQYRMARAQAHRFAHALTQLLEAPETAAQVHPLLRKAQEDALRSQLADLEAQLNEYQEIRSGKQAAFELESVEELPRLLIRVRIAAGLSQKELAKRLGLKEQQIQRYEATEYASARFGRMMEVVRALGIRLRKAS
jgi:ribosome-binding protein aMBF1 (putative translation factor)